MSSRGTYHPNHVTSGTTRAGAMASWQRQKVIKTALRRRKAAEPHGERHQRQDYETFEQQFLLDLGETKESAAAI
jgi:hypothetical protein